MASASAPKRIGGLLWWQRLSSLLILIFVLGELTGFWPSTVLQRLEWLSYDLRVKATLTGEKDPSIVIVDIDEKSLSEVGQWPWPRQTVATLVERLFAHEQISLLGFDIVFAEPEGNALAAHWQQYTQHYPQLAQLPPPQGGDEVLAQTMKKYPVVMGYYFQSQLNPHDPPASGQLAAAVPLEGAGNVTALPFPHPSRYSANLPILQNAAASAGFFDNPTIDEDGVFRRVPLLQTWKGQAYPSLPLAMFHTLLGQPPITLEIGEGSGVKQLEALDVGGFRVPVDGKGAVLVPFYGPRNHFSYISAADVLAGRLPAGRLKDAVVILGSSAPGLLDLRTTPVQAVYPGPEINASILAGFLHQSFRAEPPFILGVQTLALTLIGLLMIWLYPRLSSIKLAAMSLVLTAAWIGANLWAWSSGWVIPLAAGLLLMLLQSAWHLMWNFWRESRQKNWVTSCFGQYVPPELVEEMVEDPAAALGLEGEERNMTVLFSDVRGFTSFSEKIPPQQLTEVMNRLLTPLTRAIHAERGTIDKYMGDAIMAFWGAPLRDEAHARHALDGAFAMQKALAEINQEFTAEGLPPLAMGIGLNSGPMNVGNMGSTFRMAYTVLGDNVNLGSRIEGLTKPYGVSILVSETTAEQVPEWACRRVDKVRVKGRSQPVWILEPIGERAQLDPATLARLNAHEAALDAYQHRDFAEAVRAFSDLAARDDHDKVAAIYVERAQHYLEQAPDEHWDGVWTHTEK